MRASRIAVQGLSRRLFSCAEICISYWYSILRDNREAEDQLEDEWIVKVDWCTIIWTNESSSKDDVCSCERSPLIVSRLINPKDWHIDFMSLKTDNSLSHLNDLRRKIDLFLVFKKKKNYNAFAKKLWNIKMRLL